MKKKYKVPFTNEVQLLTNAALMNVVIGSNTGAGTGSGSASDKDPEIVSGSRGEWGNLW